MRKPRPDSKLLNLPEELQSKIAHLMLNGTPYHLLVEMLKRDFQIETSRAALSNFWNSVASPMLMAQRHRAVTTADEIAAEATRRPGQFDAATIDALKQKAFELSINPGANPGDVKNLFMLVLKARDQDLQKQELAFNRQRFEFDAAKAALAQLPALRQIAGDRSLDSDARLLAVRKKLFGDAPA
jgi:hypothetical protein